MAGHSKWAQIKRKKGVKDAARGRLFSRLIREITVAARQGGGDPTGNSRLRLAIQTAKDNNMPQDNINRAIKKGTGEAGGASFEEVTYEGYGPGGVALLIETLTDNKNRTTAEVRHALTKHNGNLGENGCVAWIFETKGVIFVAGDKCDEEKLFDVALEAGAEDVKDEGDGFELVCGVQEYEAVRQAIVDAGVEYESAGIQKIPGNLVNLEGDDARKIIKLMEVLEDLEDVQRVSANFDVPPDILQEG
ncbi:MAG: YebC/PmpR family DNA-binding transcriptional regulator [Candidatus Latescibacterota bacterium]|nr:MAG: YebC/PmpR family DNA-binding transcriptional regulator [Candidatus Latescibacterota bacterium]